MSCLLGFLSSFRLKKNNGRGFTCSFVVTPCQGCFFRVKILVNFWCTSGHRGGRKTSLPWEAIRFSEVWFGWKNGKVLTKLEKTNAKWVLVFCFVRDICCVFGQLVLGLASGLEAFSREPPCDSIGALAARQTPETSGMAREFLSYYP